MSRRPVEVFEFVPPPVAQQVCRACGLRRRPTEPDGDWVVDQFPDDYRREEGHDAGWRGEARLFRFPERPWCRRHAACANSAQDVLEVLTGKRLGDVDARTVFNRHGRAMLAGDRNHPNRTPWAHVDRAERQRLAELADELVHVDDPKPHLSGRCGCCGVSAARTWTVGPSGLTWSDDGGRVMLCGDCDRLVPRAGEDRTAGLRLAAIADMVGARPSRMLTAHGHFGFKFLAELELKADERHRLECERWQYRPAALERIRAAVKANLPELLLDDAARAQGIRSLEARHVKAEADRRAREDESNPGPASDGWE